MCPMLLENIYNPTWKTNRLGTHGETGTGFGMPLVKKFVDLYNGTINIESKEKTTHSKNHGTKIIISLDNKYKEKETALDVN